MCLPPSPKCTVTLNSNFTILTLVLQGRLLQSPQSDFFLTIFLMHIFTNMHRHLGCRMGEGVAKVIGSLGVGETP